MATTMAKMRSAFTSTAKIISTCSKPSSSSSSASVTVTSKLFTSHFPTRPVFSVSRLGSAMLIVLESEMPVHSAIASARLNSNIGLDSTCWTSLSQAFAVPR